MHELFDLFLKGMVFYLLNLVLMIWVSISFTLLVATSLDSAWRLSREPELRVTLMSRSERFRHYLLRGNHWKFAILPICFLVPFGLLLMFTPYIVEILIFRLFYTWLTLGLILLCTVVIPCVVLRYRGVRLGFRIPLYLIGLYLILISGIANYSPQILLPDLKLTWNDYSWERNMETLEKLLYYAYLPFLSNVALALSLCLWCVPFYSSKLKLLQRVVWLQLVFLLWIVVSSTIACICINIIEFDLYDEIFARLVGIEVMFCLILLGRSVVLFQYYFPRLDEMDE